MRSDLVREILRRVPQWPGTDVEIPVSVYEAYVRELAKGPTPPQPPVATWTERARYRLRIDEKEATLAATFDVVRLPGKGGTAARLLPPDFAWRDVTVDGRKAELRRADDGWLYFDAMEPGRYRVTATATLKPQTTGDVHRIECGTVPAGWTSGAVDSDGAWHVRFSRSPLSVKGTGAGTHGAVGLRAGDRLDITWQPPQPAVHRAAQIATEAHVGWTLADGVHQVRAVLNLRLWGGETSLMTVNLPPGADRVRITGPDVREVQTAGDSARVFLRGAVRQRSRLNVEFEAPRPATGRMTLPAFGVEGASHRGGTLAIAGGAGGVLLEMDSPGLAAMALHDLPDRTRALLAATPVYAYRVTGPWEARVDLVSMSEFPVRETLIDSALYTVLYRPDGRVMTKVIYEVRNRALQYMTVDLPPGAELVVARVAEEQKNLARGPGRTVYVPLEKSVLTTAGLVSFPVELVYVMRGERLLRSGRFRLPLPRADLPVAYARCALMVPDGMRVDEWQGVLRRTDVWSSETAELEFEYGRGHLAEGLQPKPEKAPDAPPPKTEPQKPEAPGLLDAIGRLFVRSDTKYNAVLLRNREMDRLREEERTPGVEFDERARAQPRVLQGKNLFRAGTDYYRQGNYEKAAEMFRETVEAAPKSLEANKALQYLGNVAVALGKKKGEAKERGLRATAKAVQKTQQWGNIELRERQKKLLAQADLAVRHGKQDQAEVAYQVAVNLARQLGVRGEEAHEQEAVVRKAQTYLAKRGRERQEASEQVAGLQQQVEVLRHNITQAGGEEMQQVVRALVLADVPALGTLSRSEDGAVRGPDPGQTAAQPVPQVELGEALAEQQVTLEGGRRSGLGTGGGGDYKSAYAPNRVEHLRKQVEQLKSIQKQLARKKPDTSEQAPRFEVGDATVTARRYSGKAAGDLFGTTDAAWDARAHFGRQVAEKAEDLKAEARKATELARQGRLAEAERLLGDIEKRAHATAGAADVLARRGGVAYGEYAGLARVPAEGRPKAPVAATRPVPPGGIDEDGPAEGRPESERIGVLTPSVAAKPKPPVAGWAVAATPPPAPAVPSRPRRPAGTASTDMGLTLIPETPSVAHGRSLDPLLRQTGVEGRTSARAGEAETRRAGPDLAPVAATARRDRVPAAKRGAGKPPRGYVAFEETAGLQGVRAALEDVTKARDALEREAREQDKVKFNVEDLTASDDNGRQLVDFVARNYSWAFTGQPSGEDANGIVVRNGAAVKAGALRRGTGRQPSITGGTVFFDSDFDGEKVTLKVDDGGSLVVENRPEAVKGVQKVLERLRLNLGQRVAVASRNFFVDADTARAAGIRWKTGANGVRYAVVNDGQVRGVMDVEQRDIGAAGSGQLPPRDAYQEAVVGTDALLANGLPVAISRAGDERNTLSYSGNTLQVAHDDYLLVDNGGYLTAVKSGRMQHWSVEAAPVRFPGVPAVVVVPTVGHTVKFEKTLLDVSDNVELVADYTWQGEER